MNAYVDLVDVLGPQVAKRVEPLGDGRRYVGAGVWATGIAWLVDWAVCLLGLVTGLVALDSADLGDGPFALGFFGLVLGVPLAYGLFYVNGRALGAVLTGTRLVRLKDGGRLGFWAPWVMLTRVLLLPLLIIVFWLQALSGAGTGSPPGTTYRASVDVDATRRLWAAESAAGNY